MYSGADLGSPDTPPPPPNSQFRGPDFCRWRDSAARCRENMACPPPHAQNLDPHLILKYECRIFISRSLQALACVEGSLQLSLFIYDAFDKCLLWFLPWWYNILLHYTSILVDLHHNASCWWIWRVFLVFQALSPADKARLREEFMNEFDENRDGRIEMAEVGMSGRGGSWRGRGGPVEGTGWVMVEGTGWVMMGTGWAMMGTGWAMMGTGWAMMGTGWVWVAEAGMNGRGGYGWPRWVWVINVGDGWQRYSWVTKVGVSGPSMYVWLRWERGWGGCRVIDCEIIYVAVVGYRPRWVDLWSKWVWVTVSGWWGWVWVTWGGWWCVSKLVVGVGVGHRWRTEPM